MDQNNRVLFSPPTRVASTLISHLTGDKPLRLESFSALQAQSLPHDAPAKKPVVSSTSTIAPTGRRILDLVHSANRFGYLPAMDYSYVILVHPLHFVSDPSRQNHNSKKSQPVIAAADWK
jgi:hypothetical protein